MQEVYRHLLTRIAEGRAQSLAVKGSRNHELLWYWHVPSVSVHKCSGKMTHSCVLQQSVHHLVTEVSGDVSLSGSSGERAVRTNPGDLVSDRHSRVVEWTTGSSMNIHF